MLKELDKNALNVGDTVGVAFSVIMGWSAFRYQRIIPLKIVRITPKRTKIILEDGREIDRNIPLYEPNNEAAAETQIAECAINIGNKLVDIDTLKRNGKLFSQSDYKIAKVSELLNEVMEVLTGGD